MTLKNTIEKEDKLKEERFIANYLDFMHWALMLVPIVFLVYFILGIF